MREAYKKNILENQSNGQTKPIRKIILLNEWNLYSNKERLEQLM